MRIVVCLKQVPDTREVRIDSRTGNLIREGVPSIINPEDKNAVEEAVRLKEKHGGDITVVSMGPLQAEDVLREALAMGVDRAFLLSDKLFAGSDTSATSFTLGLAIRKLGEFDLILCGREALDGNTAQVGPQLAEYLNLAQITCVRRIEIGDGTVRVERLVEDGYELVETSLPALLTVVKDINQPRIASIDQIMESYREKEVSIWGADQLGCEAGAFGLQGSPTRIRKASVAELKARKTEYLEGPAKEVAGILVEKFNRKHLI